MCIRLYGICLFEVQLWTVNALTFPTCINDYVSGKPCMKDLWSFCLEWTRKFDEICNV